MSCWGSSRVTPQLSTSPSSSSPKGQPMPTSSRAGSRVVLRTSPSPSIPANCWRSLRYISGGLTVTAELPMRSGKPDQLASNQLFQCRVWGPGLFSLREFRSKAGRNSGSPLTLKPICRFLTCPQSPNDSFGRRELRILQEVKRWGIITCSTNFFYSNRVRAIFPRVL